MGQIQLAELHNLAPSAAPLTNPHNMPHIQAQPQVTASAWTRRNSQGTRDYYMCEGAAADRVARPNNF